MKLSHPFLNHPIDWERGYINTFVVENPKMYREFLTELNEQAGGMNGRFVLSQDEIIDISKSTEIIYNPLLISIEDNKKILTGILKDFTEIAINDFYGKTVELYAKINETITDLIFSSGQDLVFDDINDISQILKLYNIHPDTENLSLAEKILLYMELCEKYLKKKLFVFVNLHGYFSEEERELLFKDISYRCHNVLIIERYDVKSSDREIRRIIDIDLCEI